MSIKDSYNKKVTFDTRDGLEEKKTKENEVPNDYYPTSPVYDPMYKQDLLPHYTPKETLAFHLNYYPKGYIPEEGDEKAPLSVNTPEDPTTTEEKEKKEEETKDKEEEDRRESITTLTDEEEDYFDYSDSDDIYFKLL